MALVLQYVPHTQNYYYFIICFNAIRSMQYVYVHTPSLHNFSPEKTTKIKNALQNWYAFWAKISGKNSLCFHVPARYSVRIDEK